MSPHDRRVRERLFELAPFLAVLDLILVLMFIPVATVGAVTAIRTKHNSENIARLERDDRDAAMGACVRLKIQRTQQNRIALIAWTVFAHAADRESKLARRSGPQQAIHAKNAVQTRAAANQLRWTPQTDCERAVNDPRHYRAPHPRPFKRGQTRVP
jgi:hypothetical protein